MEFSPLPFEKDPTSGSPSTITSVKADGRAWKYDDDTNMWNLVDVSTVTFKGDSPIQSDVDNSGVTYSIDLNTILPVPLQP